MEILSHYQIGHKIARLTLEILENNQDEPVLFVAGINRNGYLFASILVDELRKHTDKQIKLARITLNPANPLEKPVEIDMPVEEMAQSGVILVDDVANTGRTMFYAFSVFMNTLIKKVEVAVLVDRKHKLFPIKVDYVGMSLATTIQENIKAHLKDQNQMSVTLN
jgi:pyrimidine operon attenuation protein/uracil phosphoribosyltransferase